MRDTYDNQVDNRIPIGEDILIIRVYTGKRHKRYKYLDRYTVQEERYKMK